MRIETTISGAINANSINNQGEKPPVQKVGAESDLAVKRISNETRNDVKSENVINDEMLDNAVEQANKSLRAYDKYIERSVHEKTHAIMYVLKDSVTNEVIREFPPRKIQDMIAKMWELAGLMVDERR